MKTEVEFEEIFAEIMNEKGSGNVFRTCYEFYKAGYEEAVNEAIDTIKRHKEKPEIAVASLMALIGKNYFKDKR